MGDAVFWLLLLATPAAMAWALWPQRMRRQGGRPALRTQPPASPSAAPPDAARPDAAPPEAAPPAAAPPASPTEPPKALPPSPSPTQSAHPPRTGDVRRLPLFAYGTLDGAPDARRAGAAHRHLGDYACLHLVTTGLAPARERIVEVAVVRCRADGEVLDRWTTLLDPGRDDLPGAALHGLSPGAPMGAPDFGEIASELLSRLQGCVVVAHNAKFVEGFLASECLRAGVLAPTLPALDLVAWAPLALPAPNARLATLARLVGLRRTVPSAAVDDALIVAAVLSAVLGRYGERLRYPVPPSPVSPPAGGPSGGAAGGRAAGAAGSPAVRARPVGAAGVAPAGWLADLMAELPMSAAEGHDVRLTAYVDAVTAVLPTGRIVTEEVRELTRLAVRSGCQASQLRSVWERLLESMRVAAFARGAPTQDQVRHLRAAALSLGMPTYFDDLVQAPPPPAPEPGSGTFSRPVRKPLAPKPPVFELRCGHCLQAGHHRATCPVLRRGGPSAVGGPGPVAGPGGVGGVGGVRRPPGFGRIEPIEPI